MDRKRLLVEDLRRIVAQAVEEARARGVRAHIAVVDRSGSVLVTYEMTGAPATVSIRSGLGVTGGLDGIEGVVPASLAAISKAITGAYLSSQGNAFSTRTAGQIIQEHFNPNEAHQPSGPLYGVQFSQLPCSDVMRRAEQGSPGPKGSPLGLAADPGGVPLYKNGALIGAIGVEANGLYGFDRDITDVDEDDEELVAVAGASGFAAPEDIRAERITADGRTLRFVDSERLKSDPSRVGELASLPGRVTLVPGYTRGFIESGTAFGTVFSGFSPDTGAFAAAGGFAVVHSVNVNRFPPRDSPRGDLRADEVRALLLEALGVARRTRAQIRRPLGSSAEVTISVVDTEGEILAIVRTPDAPVFGTDVAVQKARTAMFFSHPGALAELSAFSRPAVPQYALGFASFAGGAPVLEGAIAWSARAIGNLHRPYFPDGLENSPHGPLSTPIAQWSPFNPGFQLDLVQERIVAGLGGLGVDGCAFRRLRNGAQIFPGGVPIYRGNTLVGAIGVSGDGVDQDDMIAYLAVENVARAGAAISNAPPGRRADTLTPLGVRLRYVQCPQSPFIGSSDQNVCE